LLPFSDFRILSYFSNKYFEAPQEELVVEGGYDEQINCHKVVRGIIHEIK